MRYFHIDGSGDGDGFGEDGDGWGFGHGYGHWVGDGWGCSDIGDSDANFEDDYDNCDGNVSDR